MKDNPEPLIDMRRGKVALFLGILLLSSLFSLSVMEVEPNSELTEKEISRSTSDVTISYSNGPASSQSITGLYTLSFSFGGTGTVDSLTIEISDGSSWNTVTTLSSSPWITNFDSTAYSNGTYTLRATAYDSTAEENVIQLSNSFTIDNQVPEITIFTVLNPDTGAGTSASDRAWFLSLIHI